MMVNKGREFLNLKTIIEADKNITIEHGIQYCLS